MHRISIRGVAAAVAAGGVITAMSLAAAPAAALTGARPVTPAGPPPPAPKGHLADPFAGHPHARVPTPARPAVRHTRPASATASRSTYRAPLVQQVDPFDFARELLASDGYGAGQWDCLDQLWSRESGWSTYAQNASGAYGIPQALPGSKMASAGADWQTDPYTQIRWGIGYIAQSYGTPCAALSHEDSYGFY